MNIVVAIARNRIYLWVIFFLSSVPGFLISNREVGYYSKLPIPEYAGTDVYILSTFFVVTALATVGGGFSFWACLFREKPKMPLVGFVSLILSFNGFVRYLESWTLAIQYGYGIVISATTIVACATVYSSIRLYLK